MSLKKVAGLFPPLIAGLIFLLLENSNNSDQREKCTCIWFLLTDPILSLAVEGERDFSFSFLTFDIYYLPQNTNNNEIKQNSNTKANKSGEEAQKKPWGL